MLATPELEIARNLPPAGCAPGEARDYTRWLATHHYENFTVVSWLLPRRLHQHFYNVYAYCRWADDLGDEVPDPDRAIELLNAWEEELRRAYSGSATHPVFVALAETVRDFQIPMEPFADLLKPFRQDQTVHRYENWQGVLDYCRYSANPVGRLVLYLCGYRDEERQSLSDATCTALQLANFWQDVARDLDKDRIYIPLDALAARGITEDDLFKHRFSNQYAALMKDLINRTRELFALGAPLPAMLAPEFRVDIELFRCGGLAILNSIAAVGYDTLHHRPALGRATQVRLLGRAFLSRLFQAASSSDSASGDPDQSSPASRSNA